MALQTAAVLYPLATTIEGTTGGAINVAALDDVEPGATALGTSVINSTQGTNAERRFNPNNSTDSTTTNASTTNGNKGWAVPLSDAIGDMTTANGGVPYLVAQNLTVNFSGAATGTGTGNVGANDVFTPRCSLWKWNRVTQAATLIVGGSGSTVSISALTAYSGTAWSGSVTLSVPATTFGTNELLFIVMGGNLACGASLGARTTTWRLNLDVSTTNLTFATKGLRELNETAGSSSGSATVDGAGAKVLPTVGSTSGAATVAGVAGAYATTAGTVNGAATVAGSGASVAATAGSATGSATVTGSAAKVLGTVGTVNVGAGGGTTVIKRPVFLFDD